MGQRGADLPTRPAAHPPARALHNSPRFTNCYINHPPLSGVSLQPAPDAARAHWRLCRPAQRRSPGPAPTAPARVPIGPRLEPAPKPAAGPVHGLWRNRRCASAIGPRHSRARSASSSLASTSGSREAFSGVAASLPGRAAHLARVGRTVSPAPAPVLPVPPGSQAEEGWGRQPRRRCQPRGACWPGGPDLPKR